MSDKKGKPKVLEEEEEYVQGVPVEEEEKVNIPSEGESVVSAVDDIVDAQTRLKLGDFVGKLVLIRSYTIRPTISSNYGDGNTVLNVSEIDGCIIDDDKVIEEIKKEGRVTDKVKALVRQYCTPQQFYSSSNGIAISLNSYVKPALSKGAVLVKVSQKKSKYNLPMTVLESPFS